MTASFKERLQGLNPLYGRFHNLRTLQINLGNLCNLSCKHCHVKASPRGKQIMDRGTMLKIISVLAMKKGITLDITGGCPEMNPYFRFLIEKTSGLSLYRMIRTNLTIMTIPEMRWIPEFYREQGLVIIASLPCYQEENVDRQRGRGVFTRSIAVLKELNRLGYGRELELNLVFNPGADFIPGSQKELEALYRKHLRDSFGIIFNKLYTITNAPIGRFREFLEKEGAYDNYLNLLTRDFNPDTAKTVMCRSLISVDWKGALYNCDFNQAQRLPIRGNEGKILFIDDLEEAATEGKGIVMAQHCYSCTTGEGSSCDGSLIAYD